MSLKYHRRRSTKSGCSRMHRKCSPESKGVSEHIQLYQHSGQSSSITPAGVCHWNKSLVQQFVGSRPQRDPPQSQASPSSFCCTRMDSETELRPHKIDIDVHCNKKLTAPENGQKPASEIYEGDPAHVPTDRWDYYLSFNGGIWICNSRTRKRFHSHRSLVCCWILRRK